MWRSGDAPLAGILANTITDTLLVGWKERQSRFFDGENSTGLESRVGRYY